MRDSAPMCCVSWRKRVREAGRYGFLLGVLEGLRYRVDAPTRALIDDVLRHVKKNEDDDPPGEPTTPEAALRERV